MITAKMKKDDVQGIIKREKFEYVHSNYLWYNNYTTNGTQWLICTKHEPFKNLKETIVYPVAMERAPFYLTRDGGLAFNIHLAKMFVERAMKLDASKLSTNANVCRFVTNVGTPQLLCDIPSERRCVYRVPQGVLLCSTDKANGIPFANTFVGNDDLKDDQRLAVQSFDEGKKEIAAHRWLRLYFRNRHKSKFAWNH